MDNEMARTVMYNSISSKYFSVKFIFNDLSNYLANWVFIFVLKIQWTASCTNALIQSKTSENNEPLKNILEKQESILSTFSNTIRGNLQKIDRLKIVALVTIEIHARDVIDKMYKSSKRVLTIVTYG